MKKQYQNQHRKKHSKKLATYREAPKEKEKPEEVIEQPVQEKPQPAPKPKRVRPSRAKPPFDPEALKKRPRKTIKGKTTECDVRQRHLQQSQRGKEQSDEREIEILASKIL